jgi:hypothetical protein
MTADPWYMGPLPDPGPEPTAEEEAEWDALWAKADQMQDAVLDGRQEADPNWTLPIAWAAPEPEAEL